MGKEIVVLRKIMVYFLINYTNFCWNSKPKVNTVLQKWIEVNIVLQKWTMEVNTYANRNGK